MRIRRRWRDWGGWKLIIDVVFTTFFGLVVWQCFGLYRANGDEGCGAHDGDLYLYMKLIGNPVSDDLVLVDDDGYRIMGFEDAKEVRIYGRIIGRLQLRSLKVESMVNES